MAKKNRDIDDNIDDFDDFATGSYSNLNKLLDNVDDVDDELDDDDDDEYDDNLDEEIFEDKNKKGISNIKPKLMGKHSLVHDNIFKGKKIDKSKEPDEEYIIKNAGGSFDIGEDSLEYEESRHNMEYHRNVKLQNDIYACLKQHTDIKFTGPRRKCSQYDFNNYFKILLTDLKEGGYTYTEIFIELSLYFSDNTWAVYLMLDSEYKNIIINELKDKRGISEINKINFI